MQPSYHGLSLVPQRALAIDQGRLTVELMPAATGNDEVTAQTIQEMCRYIRQSLDDPLVARAAAEAQQRFGSGNTAGNDGGRSQKAALDAWGVFWYIKHLVKFRLDEGALMEWQGEQDQQDFLIAPHVLLRMREPKEDCDGFSMLTCALLTKLGIPAYLITVAVDPQDPERWSHVFVAAMVDGSPLALDTSHGRAPGEMPRVPIYRLQAWDLNGKKLELPWKLRKRSQLHGYMRVGLGQTSCPTTDPVTGLTIDQCAIDAAAAAGATNLEPTGTLCPDGSFSVSGVCPTATPSTPSSFTPASIAALISSAATGAANDIRAISAPAGYVYNPATGQYIPAVAGVNVNPLGSLGTSLGSMLPLLGIGLLAVLLIGAMGKK